MPTRRGEAFFLTPINNAGILSQKMLRPYRMIRGDINNVKNAGTMRPVGLSTMNFTQNIQKPSLTKLTASLPNITVSRIRNWILSSTMTSNTVWDAGQIPTRRGEAFFLTPINYARTFSQKMLRPYNKTQ
jgi:preprotein translocase subunit SecB